MVLFAQRSLTFVKVEDNIAKEYEIHTTENGNKVTTTCFIEAEENKPFTVWLKNTPNKKGYQTRMSLTIDGHLISFQAQCGKNPLKSFYSLFRGYRAMNTGAQELYRAFTFGKLTTTADALEDTLTAKVADEICTIRLDIQVLRMIGDTKHGQGAIGNYPLPTNTQVHEDSKAAMWGISAQPGELIQAPASRECFCLVETTTPIRQHIIIFRYVPRSYLIARGHDLSNGNGAAMSASTSNANSVKEEVNGKRESQESAAPSTDEDTKADLKVKSEGLDASISNDRKRPRITMDLTTDGDGYRLIKSVRETIVISDDES